MPRYLWNEKTHKLELIDEGVAKIPMPVWFPKGGTKYFDKALRRTFHSKSEKRDFLLQHKLRHLDDGESDKHRYKRLADEINADREKRGEKPKTMTQLRGQ